MTSVLLFLGKARRRLGSQRAWLWVIRGSVVVAVGALASQAAGRWWTAERRWPLYVALASGLLLGAAGWLRSRPSLTEVAGIADARLVGKERLATAFELALASGPLVLRQRADADAWARRTDAHGVGGGSMPSRELAVLLVIAALAAVTALMAGGDTGRARVTAAADEAARAEAARQVADLADLMAVARPGEDEGRRKGLTQTLRALAESLRESRTTARSVQELSRAQVALRTLVDPEAPSRRDASVAMESSLAQAASSAAAAAAVGGGSAEQQTEAAEKAAALNRLAESLPALSPDAAKAAANHGAAAVAAAAELVESLASVSQSGREALAQALGRSADAAQPGDPKLAADLRRAAAAAQAGQPQALQEALDSAARRGEEASAADDLDSNVSQSSNALEATKQGLLDRMAASDREAAGKAQRASAGSSPPPDNPEDCGEDPEGAVAGAGDIGGHVHDMVGHVHQMPEVEPSAPPESQACTTARAEAQARRPAESQDDGGGQPSAQQSPPGPGRDPASGAAQGAGQGPKPAEGESQGVGQGQSPESGASTGSGQGGPHGSGSGGSSGPLGRTPGLPNEQVFVPGMLGPGRTQALPGEGRGEGAGAALVPYEAVYAQYRATALTQADRQLVPVRLRDMLRRYFQDAP